MRRYDDPAGPASEASRSSRSDPRRSAVSALARWCSRRRFVVLVLSLLALVGPGGAVGVIGTSFNGATGECQLACVSA